MAMLAAKPTHRAVKTVESARAQEIYVKSAHVFHHRGFDATSMEDLAKHFQMTKPGLYYYIGSKQDLLYSIMTYAMDWLDREVVVPANAESDARQRLEFIIRRHGRELIEGPHAISILSDEIAALKPKHRRRVLERKRAYFDLVRNTLNELKGQGKLRNVDTTVAAYSFFGTLMWLPRWYQPKGRLSTAEVLDELVKIISSGLLLKECV